MKRTIKFRGFVLDTEDSALRPNVWEYGDLLHNQRGLPSETIYKYSIWNGLLYYVDPESVGEFTGLHDSEGKEIYEGDVLKVESFLTKISDNSKIPNSEYFNYYVVEFNSDKKINGWQLRVIKTSRYDNFGLGNTSHSHLWTITDKAKIIGKIYENPEFQTTE